MSLPCSDCGELIPAERVTLGYMICIPCAERSPQRITRTIVPMHKSNYMPITDKLDLKGINNKGGFHR